MHKKRTFYWLVAVCCCIQSVSCGPSRITTTWKPTALPFPERRIDQILIICIVGDSTSRLRSAVESQLVGELKKSGYQATSSIQLFGRGGLPHVDKEELWRRLCNQGIDAVVTVTLIDKNKEIQTISPRKIAYGPSYYYDRITRYRNLVVDLDATELEASAYAYWEVVVFDLFNLVPTGVLRSRTYYTAYAVDLHSELPELLVRKLKKEKILDGSWH